MVYPAFQTTTKISFNMKRLQSFLSASTMLVALAVLTGCDKNKPYDIKVPDEVVHFVGGEIQSYSVIANPNPVHNLVVGATTVSNVDRQVNFTITSSTGAQAGREYSVGVQGNTLTIPAGETRAVLPIQGYLPYFEQGEKHKLEISLTEGNTKVAIFGNKVTLNMRGPCFDSEIEFPDLLGNYTKTYEAGGSYGPYTSTLSSYSPINTISGSAVIGNIYNSGIPATGVFNWETVGNFTVTIPDQPTGFTAGGLPLRIRTLGSDNYFTYCTPYFYMIIEMYTSNGTFDIWDMEMSR